MKNILTLSLTMILLMGIVFVSGCTSQGDIGTQSKLVCFEPYILVGDSCCLDKNGDGFCDESVTKTQTDRGALYEKNTDISLCAKLKETEGKECMMKLAFQNEDLSVCRWLKSKYFGAGVFEGECYALVAGKTLDTVICERMNEICVNAETSAEKNECQDDFIPLWSDACYNVVATGLKNEKICDEITDTDTKNDCYTNVAMEKGLIKPECETDYDCSGFNAFCVNRLCKDTKKCSLSSDCEHSKYKPYCLESMCSKIQCNKDSDCSSGMVCIENNCEFISCESNSDCPSDASHCFALYGIKDLAMCVECVSDSHCTAEKPFCNAVSNSCNVCRKNSDCESGYHCTAGLCFEN